MKSWANNQFPHQIGHFQSRNTRIRSTCLHCQHFAVSILSIRRKLPKTSFQSTCHKHRHRQWPQSNSLNISERSKIWPTSDATDIHLYLYSYIGSCQCSTQMCFFSLAELLLGRCCVAGSAWSVAELEDWHVLPNCRVYTYIYIYTYIHTYMHLYAVYLWDLSWNFKSQFEAANCDMFMLQFLDKQKAVVLSP